MMRRVGVVAAALVLTAGAAAAVLLATPATAAPDPDCATPVLDHDDNFSSYDINGDAFSDVVVGVPHATSAGAPGAGVVDIHFPHPPPEPAPQRFGESYFGITPTAHDNFGASVAVTQFGAPGTCADVVIGAPGVNGGAGAVTIGQGSNAGIKSNDDFQIAGQAAGDHFGAAVAAGGGNIWVGAPGQTVDGREGAGAVYHYSLDGGTQLTLTQVITEDSPGIPGNAETDDHFGQVLALGRDDRLAIGEPGEDVGNVPDAGAVTVIVTNFKKGNKVSDAGKVWQDSPHVSGTSEPGDGFGSSVSYDGVVLVVGVPFEDLGNIRNAGMVQTFIPQGHNFEVGRIKPGVTVTQESAGMPGVSESSDRFGAAVQVGDGDRVWIGVPGESLRDVAAAGDVIRTREVRGKLRPFGHVIRFGDGADGANNTPQAGAHVGSALSTMAVSDEGEDHAGGEGVVVTAPGLDIDGVTNAGEVDVDGDAGPLPIDSAGLYRDSAGPRAHELYGVPASMVTNGGPTLN
jgi:hypothetical protein